MLLHPALVAVRPNSSLSAPGVPIPAVFETQCRCHFACSRRFLCRGRGSVRGHGVQPGSASREALGIFWFIRVPSRSYPVLFSGSRFGAFPAPCGTASFCFLGTSQNKFESRGKKHRTNFFRAHTKKALLGTWEPGPLARFAKCDPSRIREIQRNGDHYHVPEQSNPYGLPRQRRGSTHR
jgi:hypothetical protein